MSGVSGGQEPGWKHYLRLVLNILIPFAGWFLLCFLGPKLLAFFMPFVIGWIIAMITNPLVRFLEKRARLVRRHSSFVIVISALALVVGLLYLAGVGIFRLMRQFMMDLPALYAGIERCAPERRTDGKSADLPSGECPSGVDGDRRQSGFFSQYGCGKDGFSHHGGGRHCG